MSFSFGTPKTATGFTLPTATTTPSTPATGGAGDTKQQTKPISNLFGSSTPVTSTSGFSLSFGQKTAAPSLSFSTATTTTVSTLSFGTSTTTATTSTPSFSFSTATSTATPQFSLGGSSATTTAATVTTAASTFTPLFGTAKSLASSTSTPAASTPLRLTTASAPTSTAATSAPSFSLGALSATTTQTTSVSTATSTTTAAAAAATTATVSTTGALTYAQLEDNINKWTIDLEEQGKFFINQAKQLNAWDSLLISNSDKILQLNETIERVKQQQKQLDQELDFILAQQNELDELSAPLEKQLADIPVTDQNRFQTYQLAEIIDSQLKQMSEDLKEIVEHLNESNKEEDMSDPVIQISRILNAHMNSLQWIDRNTAQITNHLEQITQMHESYKKSHLNL